MHQPGLQVQGANLLAIVVLDNRRWFAMLRLGLLMRLTCLDSTNFIAVHPDDFQVFRGRARPMGKCHRHCTANGAAYNTFAIVYTSSRCYEDQRSLASFVKTSRSSS